jgi:hypothetical protein
MSSIAPRQALPSGGPPLAQAARPLRHATAGPGDWPARLAWRGFSVTGCKPAKLSAVTRPPFIIGGQADTARRLKVGEPDDASDECQSLGRFNLPGSKASGVESMVFRWPTARMTEGDTQAIGDTDLNKQDMVRPLEMAAQAIERASPEVICDEATDRII